MTTHTDGRTPAPDEEWLDHIQIPRAGKNMMGGSRSYNHAALQQFVDHCDRNGREREAVGVFLLEPHDVVPGNRGPATVRYRARFQPPTNVSRYKTQFEVDTEQLVNHVQGVLEKVGSFWALHKLADDERVYNPLLGLGHSHPGGTRRPSQQDLESVVRFTEWQAALRDSVGAELFMQKQEHYLLAFHGKGPQTLTRFGEPWVTEWEITGAFV